MQEGNTCEFTYWFSFSQGSHCSEVRKDCDSILINVQEEFDVLQAKWVFVYILGVSLKQLIGICHLFSFNMSSLLLFLFPTFPRELFDKQRKCLSWLLSPLGYMCRWMESFSSWNRVRLSRNPSCLLLELHWILVYFLLLWVQKPASLPL